MNILALALSVTCAVGSDGPVVHRSPGGRVLHASGPVAPPLLPDAADAARLYVRQNPSAFGVGGRHGLVLRASPAAGLPGIVSFERTVDGLPVYGARVNFAVDASRAIVGVAARDVPETVSGRFLLGERAAGERARAALHAAAGVEGTLVDRGWWSNGSTTRAAYRARLSTVAPTGAWEVLVDAEDGRVLMVADLIQRATGRVYNLSPVELAGGGLCAMDGNGRYFSCAPTALRTLPNLTSATTLTGSQARVYNCRGTTAPSTEGTTAACDQNARPTADAYDFPPDLLNVSPADDFAAVMAYYQIDRHVTFLKDLDPASADTLAGLPVFVNAYDGGQPFDNAYFSPLLNGMVLGQGTRLDFAYDASVAYHELTHAVVSQFGGFNLGLDAAGAVDQPAAVNEGTADSLTVAATGKSKLGYFVGNWMATSAPPPFMRDMANRKTCRGTGVATGQLGLSTAVDGLDGEAHDDGEIWNGFFWEMHEGLKDVVGCDGGCDAGDAIQYGALQLAAGTSPTLATYGDSAAAVAQALYPDRPNVAAYVRCVAQRHELATCDRTFPVYAGEKKVSYVRLRYGSFQFAVQATGTTSFTLCSGLNRGGYFWARIGQPVRILNPDLSSATTVEAGAPTTYGPFPLGSCSGTKSRVDATLAGPAVLYVLSDNTAAIGETPDIVLLEAGTTGMASRPVYPAPVTCTYRGEAIALASLSPASGPTAGGTEVVLAGTNFDANTTVTFGGAAASITARSTTSLTAVSPAHSPGAVDVVVHNGRGLTATLSGSFTYVGADPGNDSGGGGGCSHGGGTSGALALIALLAMARRRAKASP